MNEDEDVKDGLLAILGKLEIKSAVTQEFALARMFRRIANNYGQPDVLYVDPYSFDALRKKVVKP